ncbi:hypothetical protein K437DRAFT_275922 [Tilletiaria anomala UBC 951]|uniref:Uncharacterized protein n=1 Tax=Tilletiaria anomala (strain ATCC 24038 / CBS 436.72 / UBC 951) TaxID=1037660 RepID=A0A066VHI3_TILAU|nr:uncharacterized protein K437DRAFT_275922 [Tilletiaria anomala UBC 951]KDN39753.1 hypothetical protein K437DRAFT_275922 [Tilletiaria anomala UBC 951]
MPMDKITGQYTSINEDVLSTSGSTTRIPIQIYECQSEAMSYGNYGPYMYDQFHLPTKSILLGSV